MVASRYKIQALTFFLFTESIALTPFDPVNDLLKRDIELIEVAK